MINKPQHGLKQFPLIIHSGGKAGFQRLEDTLNLHPASFVSKSVCWWEGVCHSVLLVIPLKQDLQLTLVIIRHWFGLVWNQPLCFN